ncbi:protein bric-a-brac 1 isoform X2 [Drosophila pseudoobscura]|uniref:Protein bric-a-brac 1 isoform X2 n=1 Tax=Drosophila pseudoobscura pseudoobscura TaxID=46245 RepID=A0A6I8W618_DROPS|nr:protein bric-a-brac 1 isoform X2 [Drosophila pseudoobscura]
MASLEVQLDAERASTENEAQSNAEQAQSAQRQRSGGTLSPQQGGSNRSSPTTLHADDRRGSEERGGAPGGGGGGGGGGAVSNEETAGPGGSSSPVAGSPSASGSPPSTPSSQQFCLRWNNYQSNLTTIFDQLLQNECFVDVTLACDGRSMKAHKMVLSACSPYFQTLLAETPCQHPIVIMRDVSWGDLKAIVEFMYRGEINVSQDQIGPLLRIAEMLKVRGLADVTHMEAATAAAAAAASEARDSHSHKEATHRDTVEQREAEELLAFMQPEKKLRGDWDYHPSSSGGTSAVSTAGGNLELRLSPLERQQGRNVRKRRWPSADTIFNPPASPLSSLIAAERLELEQKERERQRDCSLMTPPPKPQLQGAGVVVGGGGGGTPRRLTPALESAIHGLDMPSPAATPGPRSSRALAPSPQQHHQQQQQQQQQQHPLHMPPVPPHHSHAQHLGLSPVSSQHGVSSAGASPAGESRYPLGPTAAAMAAAMELSGLPPPAEPRLPPPPPHHHSQGVGGGGGGGGGVGSQGGGPSGSSLADDMEIKPGIAEMIREEERAKMMENSQAWMGATAGSALADSYQYQLQSMWQKCWNTNQNLMHHMRFRERGPLKSWRPETMAEAIFSVLKEGLSLSQAARKYDIPYPTFVLYANRVHNMLGPSIDGGPDLRPKGRGRPQRILLGIWPDEHIKGVIKTVVFRDAKDMKDDSLGGHMPPYGRHSDMTLSYPGASGGIPGPGAASLSALACPNGMGSGGGGVTGPGGGVGVGPGVDQHMSQETAAAVAAVAHNIRQQMQMAAAVQHQHGEAGPPVVPPPGLFNLPPHLAGGPGPPGSRGSISPALSSGSGPRHAPSPCGPAGLLPNLPPSMAVALHRDPAAAALLSQHQQQQHHLQQLHLQQQQQQQQHHLHQQQVAAAHHGMPHKSGFGASSMAAASAASTSASSSSSSHQHSHSHPHSHSHSHGEKQQKKGSPHRSETPRLHSPLGDLGLEMSSYKREYSPSRLFADDLAELVGASVSSSSSVTQGAAGGGSSAAIGEAPRSSSSGGIKVEPITTTSE